MAFWAYMFSHFKNSFNWQYGFISAALDGAELASPFMAMHDISLLFKIVFIIFPLEVRIFFSNQKNNHF